MEYHVILLFNSNLIHGYLGKIANRGKLDEEGGNIVEHLSIVTVVFGG